MESSKTNIIEDIKKYSFNIIEDEYKNYLKTHNLLLIDENKLKSIISDYYNNNSKLIKSKIRDHLKEKYKEDYKSSIVENILLDIFQEKDVNIDKITKELDLLQKNNLKKFTLPLINNSLNLNISLTDNYVIINSTNPKKIEDHYELYNNIDKYKFLYSINNILLHEYNKNDKITTIKNNIENIIKSNKHEIIIECYYIKNS